MSGAETGTSAMSGAGTGVADGPVTRARRGAGQKITPLERLKVRRDFLRASNGGRVHARSLTLQVYRRRPEDESASRPRVGLTVTKKVGNAVERNRVKRRLRESLRAPGLAALPDHDYVIVGRREVLSVPFVGLVGEVRRCFGDAGSGKLKKAGSRATGGPRRGLGPKSRGSGIAAPVPSSP